MKTKLPIFATCLVFAFSTNISTAQEQGAQGGSGGGLSSLFNGIGTAIGGLAKAAGQSPNNGNASNIPQEGTGADAQVIEVIKLESSKEQFTSSGCGQDYLQKEEKRVLDPFRRAEYGMASAGAGRVAGYMALCAMNDQANLTHWSNHIGQMLAISAIAGNKAGWEGSPQVNASAHRAIVLLTYAKQKNTEGASQMLDTLKENGFKIADEKTSVSKSPEKIALSASSAEVAKKYQSNQMAFHQNYTGKIIQVTGAVKGVNEGRGNPPRAHVIISGIIRKDPNTAPMSDFISCEVTDSKELSTAAGLQRGNTITASGLYDPQLRSGGVGETEVTLHDCRISRS